MDATRKAGAAGPRREPTLSVCLIARNEAETIGRCLRSVRAVATEIIVVDTGSSDATCEIARGLGARIARVPWGGDFSQARNASLGLATSDWILVLDADEELDRGSVEPLREAMRHPEAIAYWCTIASYTGDVPDEAHVIEHLHPRLVLRSAHPRFVGAVHEQLRLGRALEPVTPRPSRIRILHYGYLTPLVLKRAKIQRNVELIEKALEEAPAHPFQWFNLGTERLRQGQHAEAERCYRRALELLEASGDDVTYLPALLRLLATALRAQGRHDEALETIARAQERYPDDTDLWYLEGTIRADLLDWAGVERAMRRCLEFGEPPALYMATRGVGTSLPHVWLGIAARETGRPQEALAHLREAVRLVPEEPLALQHAADLLTRLLGPEAAGEALAPASSRGRHIALAAARALAKAGAFAECRALLPRAADGEPEDSLVLLLDGECLFRLRQYPEAVATFLRIPARDPLGLPARLDALLAALAIPDHDTAREIMGVLRQIAPEEIGWIVRVHGMLCARAAGDPLTDEIREEDAARSLALLRQLLRTFLEMDLVGLASHAASMMRLCGISDGQALCEMGKVAYLARRPDLAGPWLAAAYAQRGLDWEGLMIAAEISAARGDHESALALARAFLGSPAGRSGSLAFYLGAAAPALARRQYSDARAFLEAARERYPRASVVTMALEKLGAMEDLQKAGAAG
jgi:tetratricopeptide (TPR) repeat protein